MDLQMAFYPYELSGVVSTTDSWLSSVNDAAEPKITTDIDTAELKITTVNDTAESINQKHDTANSVNLNLWKN